jgi:hypothetical protein
MYTVTRQAQWMGDLMVEISGGGFDYANPDMLSPKYNNEGETFDDPRDAVDAAIEIYNLWRHDEPTEDICIGYGDTLGFTMPFEASCVPEIKEWAQKEYDILPKCDRCGDILPEERDIWLLIDIDDMRFCSEKCADKAWIEIFDEED